MSKQWLKVKSKVFRDLNFPACFWCNSRQATDAHHGLLGRRKDMPELDVEENLIPVCHKCHMEGRVDSTFAKEYFWRVQCIRYGNDHMREWLDSLPLVDKPRF